MSKITFNNRQSPFFDALKEKTEKYFAEKNIKPTGNFKLYLKTIILTISAITIYCLIVFTVQPTWVYILLCALLGFSFASIGFNVMHDGAHGSYSGNKFINKMMSYSLNAMGGSSYMWKMKHNIIHHSFTNIDGVDDDIANSPWMRMSDTQPRYWFHRFQHIYWVFLYGLNYFIWVYWSDFTKYFSRKIGVTPIRKMKVSEHIGFWLTKLLYISIILIIPSYTRGFVNTLIGYTIMFFVCGFVTAIIFQLAHVIEGTSFPQADATTNKIETEWALHQVMTTANFATRSRLISWFMGGLNFQVEHHLFPRISHIHYPAISQIVKDTCREFNIRYIEYPTVLTAINAHVRHLHYLGKA